MFQKKPTREQLRKAVLEEYAKQLEQQQAVLMEAIQDAHRVVQLITEQGEPEDPQARDEARSLLHPDLYDRMLAAIESGDVEAISDSLDRLIGRLLASFHQEVLYREALERTLLKLRVTDPDEVWADDSEQDALQGQAFCMLREFATEGAWGYVIEAVAQDFGSTSPFVVELRNAQERDGLPSLSER